jgi:aminoglycoside phosphotransferase (APT) family kinase protein
MTIEEVVGRVFLWRGASVTVSPLSGGLTNENYLVEADGERYVLRIPGLSTELLAVDRANEIHNTKAAASTGVGPRVLEHLRDPDVVVLEFIPGPTTVS